MRKSIALILASLFLLSGTQTLSAAQKACTSAQLSKINKFDAIKVLRALAGNPKTPEHILRELAQIHERSLRHERRNLNGGDDPQDAAQDSYIDWKARETLEGI